jgi:hypothetical protein
VTPDVPRDRHLQNYVVAFLDLLDQKDRLRKLDRLPESQEELDAAISTLRGTLGVVLDIRSKLRGFVEKHTSVTLDDDSRVPPERRHLAKITLRMHYFGLADSTVLAVPLGYPEAPHEVHTAIRAVLAAVGAMMLDALSLERPLRGGIALGPGIQVEPDGGEVYGPGPVEAYFLECRKAEYPRVVVSAPLKEFLEATVKEDPEGDEAHLAQTMARNSLAKLGVDSDGLPILDWLGPGFSTPAFVNDSKLRASVERAFAFARGERDRFTVCGNEKLVGRYDNLLRYMETRLPAWGVGGAKGRAR